MATSCLRCSKCYAGTRDLLLDDGTADFHCACFVAGMDASLVALFQTPLTALMRAGDDKTYNFAATVDSDASERNRSTVWQLR